MRSMLCSIIVAVSLSGPCIAAEADLLAILESVSARSNKRFVLDPRVSGRTILVNVDPDQITYDELQTILSVHGFVATQESNGVVRIVPDANARQLPMPVLGAETSPGDEAVVTKVLDISPLSAAQLVPILRPLLPQHAHVAATSEPNILVLVARKDNIESIEAIIADLRAQQPVNR
jgi:general secretion pathway protein D